MIKIKGNLNKEFAKAAKERKKTAVKEVVKNLASNTPIDTGEARSGWKLDKDGNIINEVEHISTLNEGTSKQAPAYFIEQTLLAHKGIRPNGTIVRPIP